MMRAASDMLRSLLASSETFDIADLYDVELRSGETVRWTSYDMNLTVGEATYLASVWPCGPILKRGQTRIVAGLEVDTLDVTIGSAGAVNLGGVPITRAALDGALDGARLRLSRVFMPTPGDTSPGSLLLFEGRVAGVDPSSTEVKLAIKSELERLNVKVPLNLFARQCSHAVYDRGCALARSEFTDTGTVAAGAGAGSFGTDLTQADDWYTLGVIAFTSGQNVGARRAIRAYAQTGGAVSLSVPLVYVPAEGDAFAVYPGCDKRKATCEEKFDNLVHFRGFPYVPRPERARG